ncbi:ATP-binding cassette sub-family C member 4 isoform X1 [Lates calcarifer]|uniref:ATP-binding cassette sub-family C member 4 isoform X1 n=1 Tax=Lates calcarifer TaxID=8187 RepID=A0AAJ8B441_LATCA|nr:ATP-binding cassette sub-family C member 4 isoform X1 [Lates calcarifer]XP_050925599.1 ATP-binding cassette sub-family C member 4 isoform X1 [Lates calcarifer]
MSSKGSQELLFSRTPVRLDAEHTCGTKSLDAPSLEKVSVTVKSQQLLTVIGPVGAGKSSLLSAILGELPCDTGTMKVKGQLTYASQQPWVFPGTIRSNILFGRELNLQRYERVIRACALKKDLELLPYGDLTLIGDRGATLSGGQKARLNLARAVYQEADIYLLDDPLSAVDAEVGKHLFEQCICGLLRNKCRILVTHQLQTFPTDLVEITGFLVGFSKIAKHVGSYFSSSF